MGKGGGQQCDRPLIPLDEVKTDGALLVKLAAASPPEFIAALGAGGAKQTSETETPDRLPKDEWLRRQRAEAATRMEALETGIEEMREDPALYKRWLDDLREKRMYDYSLSNYLLLSMQRADLTRVASFKKWKSLGRSVRKGETSLKVLVPMTKMVPVRDDAGKQKLDSKGKPAKRRVSTGHYKLGPVFDISQTDEMEAGARTTPAARQGALECIEDLTRVAERRGVEVHLGGVSDDSPLHSQLNHLLLTEPNAGGYYVQTSYRDKATGDTTELRAIVTSKGHSPEDEARVLAHEVSHSVLDHLAGHAKHKDSSQKELEAEASAYVIAGSYGLASDFSAGYITNWTGDDANKRLRQTSETVRKTVRDIFNDLEALDAENGS